MEQRFIKWMKEEHNRVVKSNLVKEIEVYLPSGRTNKEIVLIEDDGKHHFEEVDQGKFVHVLFKEW